MSTGMYVVVHEGQKEGAPLFILIFAFSHTSQSILTDLRGGYPRSHGGSSTSSSNQLVKETDPHRLSQRQKQIDYGKNTLGYDRYTQLLPKYVILLQLYSR